MTSPTKPDQQPQPARDPRRPDEMPDQPDEMPADPNAEPQPDEEGTP